MMHLRLSACLFVVALALAACGKDKGGTGGFTHENNPDNLKKLWESVVGAMKSGDHDKATALVRALVPDKASVKKALVDDVDAAVVDKLLEQYEVLKSRMKPENAAKGFKSEREKVWVHGATTEQIAEGADAASEFPGGAKRAAKNMLEPGMTFYEVELTEPQKDIGTKFHLMYWDGSQWRMLGPVWRAAR